MDETIIALYILLNKNIFNFHFQLIELKYRQIIINIFMIVEKL